ncbi:hypothetical protein TWF173_011393 [Orbilia oligospora]|nr:hypothetical protein TWF173_011393 [Orbilia oligospora]
MTSSVSGWHRVYRIKSTEGTTYTSPGQHGLEDIKNEKIDDDTKEELQDIAGKGGEEDPGEGGY